MTKIQKAVCVVLSFCFCGVLAFLPGFSYLWENVYRQLPYYCFLEDTAKGYPSGQDSETLELLAKNNASYLGRLMEENRAAEEAETAGASEIIKKTETTETSEETEEAPEATEAPETGEETEESETPEITEAPEATEAPETREETEESETPEITEEPGGSGSPVITGTPAVTDSSVSGGQAAEENTEAAAESASSSLLPSPVIDLSPETLSDTDYLLNNFFIVDEKTSADARPLSAAEFLEKDLTLEKNSSAPQILIYHSHSQEAFADSREGEQEDTIVGVGNYLTKILTEDYGYQVLHVTEAFDMAGGYLDRSSAYDYAREYVEPLLTENPSIEIVIDLHRDGVAEDRRLVTTINGKETARIMFYNGLSYTVESGELDYLPNPYIQDNLAFSFQLEYQAALYYPGLYRGIYLAGYRYNLHLKPRALLLEAGAQTNTVQEVKNAMEPFADILDRVLSGR